jgi:hypothetical protein
MNPDDLIAGLPGEALIRAGLRDAAAGRTTVASCVIAIARSRFTEAGLVPVEAPAWCEEPEPELYRLLQQEGGDAYARYTALVRELVSFMSALDHRRRRRAMAAA